MLISLYFNIIFIYKYSTSTAKVSRTLFWFTQIFLFFAICTMIAMTLRIIFGNSVGFIRIFVVISLGNQMEFLLVVFFLRLYTMFKNTFYELHTNAVYSYIIALIFLYCTIPVLIFVFRKTSGFFIVVVCIFVVAAILQIIITTSFVKKTFKVNKLAQTGSASNDEIDAELLNIITKTSILFIISCIFTVLNVISLAMRYVNENYDESVFPVYFGLMDSFTNAFCILLSFKYFEPQYLRICGCLDKKCKALCHNMTISMSARQLAMSMTPTASTPTHAKTKAPTDYNSAEAADDNGPKMTDDIEIVIKEECV